MYFKMEKLLVATLVLFALVVTGQANALDTEIKPTTRLEKNKEWWEYTKFYQIYPRSFKDGNGDGIGDFIGITSHLEHLVEAGVNTIWLSPCFMSPLVDLGYDVSNFYEIHPDYGTMEDFQTFLDKAHSLDLKVLLDFVPNHSSDQHQWFIDSENRVSGFEDFYVWRNASAFPIGAAPIVPNNWVSVFSGPAWTWSVKRQQFYLHQFTKEQPDLNYRNPVVLQEMNKVLLFWLNKGADGFRLDAINHMFEDELFRNEEPTGWVDDTNSYDFLHHYYTKDVNGVYDVVYGWRALMDKFVVDNNITVPKLLMTEAYANITFTMKYYQSDDGTQQGANMPFNFQLIYGIEGTPTPKHLKDNIDYFLDYMPSGKTSNWVTGSHDHSRVASRAGPNYVDIANVVGLTLPGVSITYYGDEIGMEDNTDFPIVYDGRDFNRTPMQWDDTESAGFSTNSSTWLPVHANYRTLNVKVQKEATTSHFAVYKTLSTLRNEDTFIYGGYHPQTIGDKVFAFVRELNEHPSYAVAINLNNTDVTADLSVFPNLPETLIIVATGVNSKHTIGDEVNTKSLVLTGYESIVLRSSANGLAHISLTFLLIVVLHSLF